MQIATSGLVTVQFGSVMMALFLSALIVWNIQLLPVWFDFSETPLIGLLSGVTALIAALLILGGIYNGIGLIRNLTLMGKAPLCHRTLRQVLIRIVASILYSFIPWVYWFGAGFLNDTVFLLIVIGRWQWSYPVCYRILLPTELACHPTPYFYCRPVIRWLVLSTCG